MSLLLGGDAVATTTRRFWNDSYIAADPAETRNIANQHPDTVKNRSAKVESWFDTLPKEFETTNDKGE